MLRDAPLRAAPQHEGKKEPHPEEAAQPPSRRAWLPPLKPMTDMRRAVTAAPAGTWPGDREVATVTLAFDDRHRRRVRLTDDAGEPFLLDLAEATLLNDGDGLTLDGDGVIAVRAAPEAVLDIASRDPAHTARLAWHVGNRHVPLQVLPDGRLRIRADHVLESMLKGLDAELTNHTAPFTPEPGAYAGHGHDH